MRTRLRSGVAFFAALAALACYAAPVASAATPELFWQAPEDGKPGGEAGRFNAPGGIATDPDSGHLFIADRNNARIVELTAWGEFVKAWGWGVVASGPGDKPPQNERQQLTVSASAGTYKLQYFNVYDKTVGVIQITIPIGFDWPASDPGTPGVIDSVQEALEELPSLKAAPGSVNVSGGPGDAGGTNPYEIEFTGDYADKDIPPLAVTESTLTGTATVATLQDGGSFEVCVVANGDVCQAGQPGGNAPGEMPAGVGGIALDEGDNVYVYEQLREDRGEGRSMRVQKFSPAGEFLAMWGGEVNKTKSAEGGTTEAERNLCTKAQVEGGDVCGTGIPGTGKGQFVSVPISGDRIATGPDGSIYVGDAERIQKFSSGGSFESELKVPGEVIFALEMDASGSFYASFATEDGTDAKSDVHKLTPGGEEVTEVMAFGAAIPKAIAVDGAGNVYVVDHIGPVAGERDKVIAYEADGTPMIGVDDHLAESGNSLGGVATSEACEIPGVDLYVSDNGGFVSAFGPSPLDFNKCPPPKVAPTIARQFAKAVGIDSATVGATINPQFWNDTRYHVEYGTGKCSESGCTKTQPLPPGSLLTSQRTKQALATQGVLLSSLSPSTTYHYRFIAESSGGGPVHGIDPDGEGPEEASVAAGLEASFKTRLKPPPDPEGCPNAGFRNGVGARLPDCRAYEMVSPVDKENGDVIVLNKPGAAHAPLSLNQSSPDGELLTYSSYRAFGDAQSAPITSTYLASRSSTDGWSSHGISPPRGRSTWPIDTTIDTQFKAFAPGLCDSWLVNDTDPPLSAGAPAGFANIYRRDNCGAGEGSYQALIPVPPESIKPRDVKPELQGTAADGGHALFRIRDKLTANAIPCAVPEDLSSCKNQLYEALPEGGIRAVCILPGETMAPNGCSAGSASGLNQDDGRSHMVNNAISADGSRIFWSDLAEGSGHVYVRIGGTTTQAVSEDGEALSGLAGKGSQYWTAAEDGSAAIFSVGGLGGGADLYEYRLEGEATQKIAGKIYGLLGASEDAQRIYLVSGEALDAGATANEPNLYLYEAGEGFTFIGTLSAADATSSSASVPLSPVDVTPKNHTAQVSPDGQHAAFMSTAPLTGFDNTDAQSGEADAEVFLYDAEQGKLRCVSCNPTGALPSGRDVGIWAAAQIPVTQTQLYQAPQVLSPDGRRLYFESFEALAGADTNGKKDVYQWEALGEGGCKETSPSFDEAAEGCVDLISSGASKEDSSLVDISADGRDVFFTTSASLLPQDPGLVDIYDARVLGGFPSPPAPKPPCEGEACQSPPPPPAEVAPGSASFRGPGNAKASARTRKRCPAGKRKVRRGGKSRCVAKKQRKAKQRKAKRYTKAGR